MRVSRRGLGRSFIVVLSGLALGVPTALAEEPPVEPAASQTVAPAPTPEAPPSTGTSVERADTLTAPSAPPVSTGGGVTAKKPPRTAPTPEAEPEPKPEESGGAPAPAPSAAFTLPSLPSSSCAPAGVPAVLIPIYQRASDAYGLGPQGPSILAAINGVETAFGTNLNVSSAGAIGWMQFMPETWDGYGVDANGDGVRDPYNPEDAIFAAASYLQCVGDARRHLRRDLLLQPRRLVRGRGAGQRRVLRPPRQRGGAGVRPDAEAAGAELSSRRSSGASGSRRPISMPSRVPPHVTAWAARASGRWPRSLASSRTSARGCRRN